MEKKRLSDKEMTDQLNSVIDGLVESVKKASRQVFDLMVERTAQTTSEVVDEQVGRLKEKMKEKDYHEKEDPNN